jgi:hypothetical protein
MGYLGYIAPFYISRYRLKSLADRASKPGLKLAGKLQIPGIGEFQIDHQRLDSATGAMLERVVVQMEKERAIGDPREGILRFGWIWIKGKMAWVRDQERGVDHLIAADLSATIPPKWCCLLVGSRTNLMSLEETEIPFLGSSPIAIQTALELYTQGANTLSGGAQVIPSVPGDTCMRLMRSAEVISADPTALEWGVVGLVEVIARCPKNQLIVGSPLFLTYHSLEIKRI